MRAPAVIPLSASRQHRRARIVAAALAVAAEGYGAVQVRTVAQKAGMSASTIYKYFSSKDDMLVACLHHWLTEYAVEHHPPRGSDPYQALAHQAGRVIEQLCATEAMADSMARAYLYADGAAATNADLVRETLVNLFARAMRAEPGSRDHRIAELFADSWATNVLAVAQKRLSLQAFQGRLEQTLVIVRSASG
jgi:AcrR family transcriptional regulator